MRIALFILLTCCWLSSSAQTERWLSAEISHGFFVAHRASLPQLLLDHAQALTISYTQQVDGSEDWHHHFRGPRKGLAFMYMDMGNPDELGSLMTLYPHLIFPLSQGSRCHGLELELGVGLAYLDKKFEREDNFFNQAIGSHLNYSLIVGLGYRYARGRWAANTGLQLSHASNATIQLPNLGVNLATLNVGLSYQINPQAEELLIDYQRGWQQSKHWQLTLGLGMRESNAFTHVKHGVQEIRATKHIRRTAKTGLLYGADIIHNRASYMGAEKSGEFAIENLQVGVKGGASLALGRASLYIEQGIYLLQGEQELGFLYYRSGGNVMLSNRARLDLSLKTHFAKADYLSLGFAYNIR